MEQRAELDAIREQLEVLQSLVKSPGWALLVEKWKTQFKAREKELSKFRIVSLDASLEHAYKRGVADGVQLAAAMPRTWYEEMHSEFQRLLEELRNAESADSTG